MPRSEVETAEACTDRAAARASIRGAVAPSSCDGRGSGERDVTESTKLVGKSGSESSADAEWPPSAWYILVVEFGERAAFYGSTIVFYPYMQNMLGFSQSTANAVYNAFNFWAYATTVLGGYVADSFLGKVKAIIAFAMTYIVGFALLFLSACPFTWGSGNFPETASGLAIPGFLVSIFFIGLGMGGIKSNVSTLMADQLGDCSIKAYASVFRWFYWSINLGAFLGILVSPVLHNQLGEKKIIDGDEDGTGYWASFGMPFVIFIISLAIFVFGKFRGLYVDHPPRGSLLADAVHAARAALAARSRARADGTYAPRAHWLDWGREDPVWANTTVELKKALRACVVFIFFPVYWLCYNQMFSNFVSQAEMLDRPSWLAAEALNVLGSLTLILIIPLFDRVIFPALKNCGYDPNPIQRISIGFLLAGSAILYCGVLEQFIHDHGEFVDGSYQSDDKLPIWWQIPPYCIFGCSEIFASVGGLEFAYAEAPKSMKSVVMAVFLITNAFGSLIGIAVSPAIQPENMVSVFLSFSGVMIGCTPIFYFMFRNRRSNNAIEEDEEAVQLTVPLEEDPLKS
eukprot:TRINITY_DN7564_c0_g1_i1.p1 TRINITY_DN7564_c0_g1~~TRINITY_DN7564_c0_g1_i1.p1  ORF type:complete len:589 (+),score=190.16 TRINITY_DN7564_c0_g1_i1:56-1768(+)